MKECATIVKHFQSKAGGFKKQNKTPQYVFINLMIMMKMMYRTCTDHFH